MTHRPGPSILIVEDERIIALNLEQSLVELGYEVVATASTAEMALSMSAHQPPDVVLMDIRLQGPHDGVWAAERLKAAHDPLVVFLTAHGDDATVERTKAAMPDGYALKPVNVAALHATISVALHRRRCEQAERRAAELEARNQALQTADRLKSAFISHMSHELRTPLNGVIGFGSLLERGAVGPLSSEQEEYVADMVTTGRRLLEVIDNVLEFTRLDAEPPEMRWQPLQVRELVGSVIDSLEPVWQAKAIRMAVTIEATCALVVNDANAVSRVVATFLSNAFKFSPERSVVALRVSPVTAGAFRIEVEDAGPGIAAEDVSRLFMPFEQLGSGTTKRHQGAGLGLAVVRRIVEYQGGQVGVVPAATGGSVFFATMPSGSGGPAVQD